MANTALILALPGLQQVPNLLKTDSYSALTAAEEAAEAAAEEEELLLGCI